MDEKPKKRWRFNLPVLFVLILFNLIIIAIAFGPLVSLLGGGSIREWMSRRRFDPIAWQQARNNFTNSIRIRMVDDLLSSYQLRGMSRQQVVSILGPPDQTEYKKAWDMVYWLGPERGFMSIDSEWLVIRLDDQEIVKDYAIETD